MIVREYEGWLLHTFDEQQLAAIGVPAPDKVRGAKEKLKQLVPGYKPTTHQLEITRQIDIERLRQNSDSFDKLVRALAGIFGTSAPAR